MVQRMTVTAVLMTAAMGALAACASAQESPRQTGQSRLGDSTGIGPIGIPFVTRQPEANQAPQIGVNAFLWRATLDTLNFMPLASEDPFGGIIITDWYSNPNQPNERFKAQVYILDTRLRADALNVSIFRQTRAANGSWSDAAVTPDTEEQIENAILRRARELRLSSLER